MKRNFIVLTLAWIVSILFINLARRVFGKTFIADDACNSCGRCVNACPVKAIYMHNGKPRWKSNCESCQRCINICHQKSIQLSVLKLVIFATFQLVPLLIIKPINNHLASFNFTINILLFITMFLANTFIADVVIKLMEKSTLLRKLLQINYTKSFRRNLAAGFDIKFLS
jgi:Dissimilatory sulfite reductase (desulfoviridin), alpha and beta subunits